MYLISLVVLCLSFCETPDAQQYQGPEIPADDDEPSPMYTVAESEEISRNNGVKPTSLMFVNLGRVLTKGSFTTNASLLSMDRPQILYRAETHTGLWEALAAPLKIIVAVSHAKAYGGFSRPPFYSTDFVQNTEHSP